MRSPNVTNSIYVSHPNYSWMYCGPLLNDESIGVASHLLSHVTKLYKKSPANDASNPPRKTNPGISWGTPAATDIGIQKKPGGEILTVKSLKSICFIQFQLTFPHSLAKVAGGRLRNLSRTGMVWVHFCYEHLHISAWQCLRHMLPDRIILALCLVLVRFM